MNITKKNILTAIFFSLAICLLSFQSDAETMQSDTLVETWLLKSCDAGEEQKVQNEIVEKGAALEPAFLEAYNNGPDKNLILEVEKSAGQAYDRRAEMLEAGETFGLSEEDLKTAKSISRAEYINQEKEAFVMRYRSQALSGLGLVGNESGYEVLKEVSEDPDSPLQVTAQEALKNIKYEKPEENQDSEKTE